ncbi:nitrate- and nitrite sensing domain-containing protein [Planotetraspora sp. A-T 1434]|uniref:sensor histidine kinase n=1 Tax=Planotetraspora sp. A-T 1434 TaxID=2979219 RepID=UPI0021BE7F6A|nr:nitrate- and nitrite sensing domain-containing protein [Planotetraspora sp. A-T 1434]MCT9932511.1 nitrate- and nitrite sensing domain-containing protein [Planotetraspora sp. A-T 1434]
MSPRRRDRPIRFRLIGLLLVPLFSLIGLWAVTAGVTIGDSLRLRTYNTLWSTLRQPADLLIVELQSERLASAQYLGSAAHEGRSEMGVQRLRTNAARDSVRKLALSEPSRAATTPAMRAQVDEMLAGLNHLDEIRAEIDEGLSNRLRAIETYNLISDAIYRMHYSLALIDDIPIYQQSRVVISLGYAKELLTREQAIEAGAAASGTMTEEERKLFTQLVGNRRFLIDQALPELDTGLRQMHVNLITTPLYQRLRLQEEKIISGAPLSARTQRVWQATSDDIAESFQTAQTDAGSRLAERAAPIADAILRRAVLAGGAGLLVVIVSILISLRVGSRLARELAGLRHAALDLANVRLPRVLEKLKKGDDVDLATEAPAIQTAGGTTEIQDVGRAFSTVQQTAVEAAIGQARLQRGVSQVFLNLARRSQTLLHRQRTQLDGMQRRTTEPDTLEDLFRLDHLTTRMRRHAEGLIILSGAAPGRVWRKPVALYDVVRGAAAEVEDYKRVTVFPMADNSLDGAAVADVIHLIAELIENATIYSPPHTTVSVRGEIVGNGFVVEIEDRGLGMTPERLAELNERLASPPEFDLADTDCMGLFVVARLAARRDIRVTLRPSPYGGTTAIVLIPSALVVGPKDPDLVRLADEEVTPEDIILASLSRSDIRTDIGSDIRINKDNKQPGEEEA